MIREQVLPNDRYSSEWERYYKHKGEVFEIDGKQTKWTKFDTRGNQGNSGLDDLWIATYGYKECNNEQET